MAQSEQAEKIARRAAQAMQGKDWHKLNHPEKLLCKLLEETGYIIPNEPCNGFIGKAAT